VWHGIVLPTDSLDHIAGLPCCDPHLAVARLTADYVHPLVHPCCLPGSDFVEQQNVCVLRWDERRLLAEVAVEVPV